MKHRMTKMYIALALIISLVGSTAVVFAEESTVVGGLNEKVSAEAMVVDLFFLRPVGFAATVVGTAVWILALPFTLPTKSEKRAAEKLLIDPAKYTFARPLGQT